MPAYNPFQLNSFHACNANNRTYPHCVTALLPVAVYGNQDALFVSNYEKKVPLGRMGNPNDIAPVVSFLLSEEAKYITGQNIIVDGGWTCI